MSVRCGGSVDRVVIVLGIHDAGLALSGQLNSYLDQTWRDWDLLIGDDGASGQDMAVLAGFRQTAVHAGHRVEIRPGPRQGFACNYLTMLRDLPPDTGFAALSDQDDIWLAEKLERAVAALKNAEGPAVYCGARLIWNPDTDRRVPSRPLRRGLSFRNALVENVACGNTIVLNRAALNLIRVSHGVAATVPFHDWWIYLLVTGAGGQVIHDPVPQVLYRQHAGNALGAGEAGWNWARARRDVAGGLYRARLDRNLAALSAMRHVLTPEHQALLDRVLAARQAPWAKRLRLMAALGLYRQDRLSQLGLWGAFALARF